MIPFTYREAEDAGAALGLLGSEPGSKFLAGGTTLLDLMKLHVENPHTLIDINRVPSVEIRPEGDGVFVGAMVRNADMARHPMIAERYPMLTEAILSGASPQLRNMATLGGNLMQRTRCAYFREPELPCNKRQPGSGCGAREGVHRVHAILGTSDECIATNPGDMSVALAALGTQVHLESRAGQRTVALVDFHLLPGSTPERETVLGPDEIITGITIPAVPFARSSRYLKVRDRQSYEFALVSAGVALDLEGDTIREARVAMGGVGTKPWRSREAEAQLSGAPAVKSTFEKAAEAALAGARPLRDNAFKVELAKRALCEALRLVSEGVKA